MRKAYTISDQSYFNYVYQYKDHLGNVRLNYGFDPVDGEIKIIDEHHYYPFGLEHTYYNTTTKDFELKEASSGSGFITKIEQVANSGYQYKYNGKELQDELGLNWHDYQARNYDPALGRWFNIDTASELSRRFSPYTYVLNNPLRFIDPDGMIADDVIARDEQSQKNIKNQLKKEDQKYVQFDENGKLNTKLLNEAKSNSSNLKNLRVLANSETTYAFSSSDSYETFDTDTGEVVNKELVASNGTKGITLFNEKVGKNSEISIDENVNIVVNNKASERETAKTTAHEIVHGVAFELKALGYDPNHNLGFKEGEGGVLILTDKNVVLKKEIKAREKEAYKNFDDK